jgi:environmental stress-induced protein Ves
MTTAPEPLLVFAPQQPSQPWRNGGGETRELLVWPAAPASWQLRISLARIDHSGPFSEFAGVERWFAVIEGAGVLLRFRSREVRMDQEALPLRFDGGLAPDCQLIDGPTNDLNLMCRGGKGRLQAAESGQHWEPDAIQSGIFARVAGIWSDEAGARIKLAPNTLLWSRSGVQRALFEASAACTGPTAYWLAFRPEIA